MSSLCFALVCLAAPQGLTAEHQPKPPPGGRAPRVVVRDTGLAVIEVSGERHLLARVDEAGMRVDLNQDGDKKDAVLFVHDVVANTTVNLGLAGFTVRVDGERALVLVKESDQGLTDLNGDGDTLDLVYHAVDLAQGIVRSSGLAWAGNGSGGGSLAATLDGDWAALNVGENMQGQTDLNGDGVLTEVGFVWNLAAPGGPINTQLRLRSPYLAVHHPYTLLVVSEVGSGDLTGDGDTNDAVLHAYLGGTGTIVNTGLSVTAMSALGDRSAFLVSEFGQQEDKNDDGDTNDLVAHVFHAPTGALLNLELDVEAPLISVGAPGAMHPRALALTDDALTFHVSEKGQGNTDLNGDGDLVAQGAPSGSTDTALFVHDFGSGVTRNLGLSAWEFTQAGGLVAFEASETANGQDLGGTTLDSEHIAHVHDIAANTTWNLGLPTSTTQIAGVGVEYASPFQVHGNWVAFPVMEDPSIFGLGADINGDGDEDDSILYLADVSTHQVVGLLAVGGFLETVIESMSTTGIRQERLLFHDSGVLSFLVSEDSEYQVDLTGDGDHVDLVLHFLRPDTGALLDSHVPATTPLLPSHGRWFPFLAKESSDGIDRNGDGDLDDVVLRVAHVRL